MALFPTNPYEVDSDPGDERDDDPPDCHGPARECEGSGTVRVGREWLCPACAYLRLNAEPSDDDTMNGVGVEGGVR